MSSSHLADWVPRRGKERLSAPGCSQGPRRLGRGQCGLIDAPVHSSSIIFPLARVPDETLTKQFSIRRENGLKRLTAINGPNRTTGLINVGIHPQPNLPGVPWNLSVRNSQSGGRQEEDSNPAAELSAPRGYLKEIPQPGDFNDLLSRQKRADQFTLRSSVNLTQMPLNYTVGRELPYAFVKSALSNEVGR